MAVSREQVFEVLQRVHQALEQGLPGWSVRPNITGTGAVGLYLDGPELPLMGVNLAGKPWLGLGTIDWCAGVRSTPVYAGELDALVAAAVRLASTWDAALRSV